MPTGQAGLKDADESRGSRERSPPSRVSATLRPCIFLTSTLSLARSQGRAGRTLTLLHTSRDLATSSGLVGSNKNRTLGGLRRHGDPSLVPNACRGPLGNPPQPDCLVTSPSTHIFLHCIHLHHFRTLCHVLGVTENSLETLVSVTCCDGEGQFSPWANSGYSSAAPLGVATDCNPKFKSTCHQGMLAKPRLLRPFPGR